MTSSKNYLSRGRANAKDQTSVRSAFSVVKLLLCLGTVFIRPEAMPCSADEHVLQAWLVDGHTLDLARKRFYDVGDEAMSGLNLQAHAMVEYRRMEAETLFDAAREILGI